MHTVNHLKIPPATTIRQALEIIDKGAMKIALVVDEHDLLIGTVTDGDIRRGFLKGRGFDDPIETIYFRKPTFCSVEESKDVILQKALDRKLQQIPIVDKKGRLVGIEEIDELIRPKRRANKVVIMAGGQGIRLRPLTHITPKPMLHVGKKPILELILENCKKGGFKDFIICVNYLSHVIKDYFKDGSSWDVNINYTEEPKKMGTAGALSLIADNLKEPFLVMNGDLLTDLDFTRLIDFHLSEDSIATMCVREYDLKVPFGVVNIDGGRVAGIQEKPVQKFYVSAGIYAFSPNVLTFMDKDTHLDMPNLFQSLIHKGEKISSFLLHEYWLDVGRMDDFERANYEYCDGFNEER